MAPAILLAALMIVRKGEAAPAAATEEQIAPYSAPGQLVHVAPGRTINLVCLGHGSPVVILTAGLGEWSLTWRLVQPAIARRTRVCAWDRAGYGFSSPSPGPQDIIHTTQDLEAALKGARIRAPYVLVGHSLGAYETLRFTDLHRSRVAGIVLVDPAIPDQHALEERFAPLYRAKAHALDVQVVKELQDCAAQLRGGRLRPGDPQFERCTADSGVPEFLPRLRAAIARLDANPARLLTQAATVLQFDGDAAPDDHEVINAQRRYGDLPLIVLTAGQDGSAIMRLFSGGTAAQRARLRGQVARFLRDGWNREHDAYAALSTRGRNQQVPDSTHAIQVRKAEAVITAVIEVLDAIGQGRTAGVAEPRAAERPRTLRGEQLMQ